MKIQLQENSFPKERWNAKTRCDDLYDFKERQEQ